MRSPGRILPLLLLPLLAACPGKKGGYQVEPSAAVTTAQVRNQNAYAATIYLVESGTRYRLGSVSSLSSAVFLVPPKMLDGRVSFRLMAEPVGPHPTQVSETFMLQPGQGADWQLQERLPISQVSVND